MKYKVCQKGWEFAQIVGAEGTVVGCSWAAIQYGDIGKLSEQTMKEIWNGDKINRFRESLIDGSYCYCDPEKCPWRANGTLEDHLKEYDEIPDYPREIYLGYERNCNYTCTCCADKNNEEAHTPEGIEKLKRIEKELEKCLNNATTISANGHGELFVSPHIMKVLSEWRPNEDASKVNVVLETNGSLFTPENWKKIQNLGQYKLKVSITVMGFDEATYQFLSGTKMPITKLIDNLHFVKSLREQEIVNEFEIGTVLQERNFREMPEFTKRCLAEFNVDCVRIRPYFPWGDKDPMHKWVYDIRNPYHPYYSEYVQVMKNPIFQHPKVLLWSGDEPSKQGRNPYLKDKENFDTIKWLACDRDISEKLEKYFRDRDISEIIIYGYGFTGEAFTRVMLENGIKIKNIIDKQKCGNTVDEQTIISLGELKLGKEEIPIIVTSPFFYEEIKNEIQGRDLTNPVLNLLDIVNCIEGH